MMPHVCSYKVQLTFETPPNMPPPKDLACSCSAMLVVRTEDRAKLNGLGGGGGPPSGA